jgi:hypothetical protein
MSTQKAKLSRKMVVPGTYYQNIFPGYVEFDSTANDYDLVLDIVGGGKTTVHIRSAANNNALLRAGVNLGNRILELRSQGLISSVREGDFGSMHAIGHRNSETGEEYKGTDECIAETKEFITENGLWLEENLPHVRADIEEAQMLKRGRTKRSEGFDVPCPCGDTANVSCGLGNSNHYDYRDASRCQAIWLSQKGRRRKNWYFILPCASYNGSRGVIIRLSHGTVIAWNGNEVKHCSAVPAREEDNEVFGLFVGSSCAPHPTNVHSDADTL